MRIKLHRLKSSRRRTREREAQRYEQRQHAIQKREAKKVLVEEPPKDRPKVVKKVRKQA